jgi:hypothetical protein
VRDETLIELALPLVILVGLSTLWITALLRGGSQWDPNDRLLVVMRAGERLALAGLIVLAAVTRSIWVVGLFGLLLVGTTLVERRLKQR